MDKLDSVPHIFDNTVEGDRPVTTKDLRRLACQALILAKKDDGLYRLRSGQSVGWRVFKPDFTHTERAAFFYKRDQSSDEYSRLHFRYLSQQYPEDDNTFRQTALEFGEKTDIPDGWSRGELTTFDARWTKDEPLHLKRVKKVVPSYTQVESERLNSVMLMNQVTEEMVGERTYEQMEEVRDLEVTNMSERDDIWLSDMQVIWSIIYRLNSTKVSRNKKRDTLDPSLANQAKNSPIRVHS